MCRVVGVLRYHQLKIIYSKSLQIVPPYVMLEPQDSVLNVAQ
jgi:hypothetical protein